MDIRSRHQARTAPGAELFEVKFIVPKRLTGLIRSLLRHNASVPAAFHSAHLRTTYFDDQSGTSFLEARDGHLTKKKYRLREYIDPEEGGAFYSVEVKKRYDAMTSKVKELIYRRLPEGYRAESFRSLIFAFESLLGRPLPDLMGELPETGLIPSTVVRYRRERYDDTRVDARYNLDTAVVVSQRESGGGAPEVLLDHDIFEIKTKVPGFHPEFLKDLPINQSSFSKFVWSRESRVEAF